MPDNRTMPIMDRDKLKDELRDMEGLSLKAYLCPAGFWTIGIGHNLEAHGFPKEDAATRHITEAQAYLILDDDIDEAMDDLDQHIGWWRTLPPVVQRGLVNMTFQMGIGTVKKFKNMLAELSRSNFSAAKYEALDSDWAKQTPNRAKYVANQIGNEGT